MFPSYKIGANSLSTRNERSKRALLHHGYHLVKAATRRWSVFPCGTASLAQVSTIIGPCPLQVRSVKFDVYLDCPHTQAQTRPPRNLAGCPTPRLKVCIWRPLSTDCTEQTQPQHTHIHTATENSLKANGQTADVAEQRTRADRRHAKPSEDR